MKKIKKPQFFAIYKDFNDGKVKPYDVLNIVFNSILTSSGKITKKDFCIFDKNFKRIDVHTKEQCEKFIEQTLRYYFWAKCEWEIIAIDWPYRDTINESRPIKVDVFDQLKPNIPVITDLVWNYIEPKLQKLYKNE